jgi:hypothetical protein
VIAEALDTLWVLVIAGGAWLIIGAAALALVLAVLLIALYATVRAAGCALHRPTRRPTWARSRYAAARWARRRPDYEEAA